MVGKLLAKRLGFCFMDTGIMYRAVTWVALARKLQLEDAFSVAKLARDLTLELDTSNEQERILIDGVDVTDHLRDREVEYGVSTIAKIPAVRQSLVTRQRLLAEKNKFVVVGRDIGTVVIPDAKVKIFLEASIRARAKRRHTELLRQGSLIKYGKVAADIQRRDKIDLGRADSPLRPAKDAIHIHTDDFSVTEIVEQILTLVSHR